MVGICVSLGDGEVDELIERTRSAAARGASLFELRVDLLQWGVEECIKWKESHPFPWILTLRSVEEGGRFRGTPQEQASQLAHLAQELRPDYVDCEARSSSCLQPHLPPGIQLIASLHLLQGFQGRIEEAYQRVRSVVGASLYKLVPYARDARDLLVLFHLLEKEGSRGDFIAHCMGGRGEISRLLAPLLGSRWAYVTDGKKTAEGQLSLDEVEGRYHLSKKSKKSALYLLLGDPVAHSLGPALHNRIFEEHGIDALYAAWQLSPEEVPGVVAWMKTHGIAGGSITTPLKEEMVSHMDSLEGIAQQVGAVSAFRVEGGRWIGFNSDGVGALDAVERDLPVKGRSLVVVGAGGAARPVIAEALARKAQVTLVNRTRERGLALARHFSIPFLSPDELIDYPYDVLIQASSCGMAPLEDQLPIPAESIRKDALIFELIYHPLETRLLCLARDRGAPTLNGVALFRFGAQHQLTQWLGREFASQEVTKEIEGIIDEELSGRKEPPGKSKRSSGPSF